MKNSFLSLRTKAIQECALKYKLYHVCTHIVLGKFIAFQCMIYTFLTLADDWVCRHRNHEQTNQNHEQTY